MKTISYQKYKESFFAFAGTCTKQEYLDALSDFDFLEKFTAYLYGDELPESDTEEAEQLERQNTKYCDHLYMEIEEILQRCNHGTLNY